MYLVGYNHYYNKPPLSLDDFTDLLDLPGEPVQRIISILVNAGYLVEIRNEDPPVYLPLHDIGNLRLADVLASVRQAGEDSFLNNDQLPSIRMVDHVMSEVNKLYKGVMGDRTLRDLVTGEDDDLPVLETGQEIPVSFEK
jgi:DNA-binding IscR family transcriptional regulator